MKKIFKKALVLAVTVCVLLTAIAVPASAKNKVEAVREFLRSNILFEDLIKLAETVEAGDVAKIFECVLETYPDYVTGLKKAFEDPLDPDPDSDASASIISEGDILLIFALTAVFAAALGVVITYGIMRKKLKKALALNTPAEALE